MAQARAAAAVAEHLNWASEIGLGRRARRRFELPDGAGAATGMAQARGGGAFVAASPRLERCVMIGKQWPFAIRSRDAGPVSGAACSRGGSLAR